MQMAAHPAAPADTWRSTAAAHADKCPVVFGAPRTEHNRTLYAAKSGIFKLIFHKYVRWAFRPAVRGRHSSWRVDPSVDMVTMRSARMTKADKGAESPLTP